jgi:(S)-citramalyl-CoA lyase
MVRVNRIGTLFGIADLLAMAGWPRRPDSIMVPKAESAAEIQLYDALLTEMGAECDIAAVVESGRGLQEAAAIAGASRRVSALVFGGADLSADLGCRFTWEALYPHRARVVAAAASVGGGLQVLDVPYVDINDEVGLIAETEKARNLGMKGKVCIHPSQVDPVNRTFAPSPEELARARKVIAVASSQSTGAVVIDGKMVDGPFVKLAQQIVAVAERMGISEGA